MATPVTPDVFDSPAVAILCDLERDGFRVELTADGVLVIAPRSRLTSDRMTAIAGCKDALKALVSIATDAGVHERRDAFQLQLDAAPALTGPAFLFKMGIAYVPGMCFSCGDGLPELRFGRCCRCSLAWRLACRMPVSAAFAAAFDAAPVA